MKIFKSLLFFSICGFIACTPETIPIDIPQADPKLVVYSQALPDQALVVALSKSFSALAFTNDDGLTAAQVDSVNNAFLNQFLVNNGLVTINGPDFSDTLIRATNGIYIAQGFPFTPGNYYQLYAFDPITGFEVSSGATTLQPVNLDTVIARKGTGDDSLDITVFFKVDDPEEENYYLLNVYSDSISDIGLFNFTGENNTNSFVFSDRAYEKNKVEDELTFELNPTDSVLVTLTNISRSYFDYIEARNRSDNSLLSEPVSFPTNITNGYGFFNINFPTATIANVE